ncbi:ImmA/IrrE family metallo-endopeptidase [cf. Phormidesmis sp. LEGE 11477]|uniref:ImmA/IrrE family metallo-endopeptidase n=1 Tax=cf. Phormidesmis sp. LEGE 11477 TaxID=1828680 RepID=UPI0018830DF5|nr:ImmA/IrrE family metallo-endopeptidase [cf. Phormidesmis sp. LEGE 11477]MBE9064100.1 ImmA/IrrE family metallo-endopeptidase [cf. Phormidesmis sp. LEGE 11477]
MAKKYRHGFKKESDEYARDYRVELRLEPYDPLSPWRLAEHLEIPVVTLSAFEEKHAESVYHLMHTDQKCFSAATVFYGTKRLIVVNNSHSPERQAANMSHELAHTILGHEPLEPFDESGCRNFPKVLEDEANWLGPALLVSKEAAWRIASKGIDKRAAAAHYGCSVEVMQMRLNMTGAMKLLQRSRKKYS